MESTSLFKGFSQHSERTFKKLSNKLPLKRLLINMFKNVPEKGGKSERTNLLMLNYSEEWKCKDVVKTYRKMAQ